MIPGLKMIPGLELIPPQKIRNGVDFMKTLWMNTNTLIFGDEKNLRHKSSNKNVKLRKMPN